MKREDSIGLPGGTRRSFLRGMAGAAATAAFLPSLVRAAPAAVSTQGKAAALPRRQPVLLDTLTYHTFAGQLDTTFHLDEAGVDLVLLKATDRTPAGHDRAGGSERFSLIFHGPQDKPLTQGTYTLHHGAMGAFALFIVPMGPNGHGLLYEAVFNRIVGA